MDVLEFINNGGKKRILNPNYNSQSKKNKEPKVIEVPDIYYDEDPRVKLAVQDFNTQSSISEKEAEKYNKAGVNWNSWENLDNQLAEQQGFFTKAFNSLAQTLVSEVGLGIPIAAADLISMPFNAIFKNDNDYSNPVTEYLEDLQEKFRNATPIYYDKSLNISNGGLFDSGYIFSNVPSIASSLTLLIPSMGATKALSYVGKAGKLASRTRKGIRAISGVEKKLREAENLRKLGKSAEEIQEATKLSKFQKVLNSSSTAEKTSQFLNNGMTAALSRAMENYQEARQTYNDMYVEASEYFKDNQAYSNYIAQHKKELQNAGVDINDKDAVAKHISSQAAGRTNAIDWLNVGWDVLQVYGLKNAWKGIKNADNTAASVRRAELDARKYFGKTPEEIAKIKANRTFMEKMKEKASDYAYGTKSLIKEELSEGAEEALNYIATEEGMRYGKVLLGTEKGQNKDYWENLLSGFDGRFNDYLKAPELWDSAFWGVLGGVVFEAGGNRINRIAQKLKKSDATKGANEQRPWWELDELPENQRRIAEIEARSTDFAIFKNNLDKINKGINIFESTDKKQITFGSEEEKAAAREQLKDNFIASMTLRAMNSGNYDMLKAFLQDDNVRKTFAESGISGKVDKDGKNIPALEEDSREYVDSIVRKMDEIANMYEQELVAADYASARIKHDIPAEYMQIIANNNVRSRLEINGNETAITAQNARIAQLEEQFRNRLDSNIDYRNSVKVQAISEVLGKLYAQKREIQAQPNGLSKELALKNINNKIKVVEDELTDSQLVFATANALRYKKGENGTYTQEDTDEYFKYVDAQITNRKSNESGFLFTDLRDALGLSDRAATILSDYDFENYKVFNQDTKKVNSDIVNISDELQKLYAQNAIYALDNKILDSELVKTVDEVKEYTGMLHNTMDAARVEAINQANTTVMSLYMKYGHKVRDFVFKDLYDTDSDISGLSAGEERDLKDALKVLSFNKSYNKSLGAQLELLFARLDAVQASRDSSEVDEDNSNQNDNTSQENATSEQPISDGQNSPLNNNTQTPTETPTEAQSGQIKDNQQLPTPQQPSNSNPIYYTKFSISKKGKLINTHKSKDDNGGAAVYDNGDGTYSIDVRNDKRALRNEALFANVDEVDLMRPYEVAEMPVFRRNRKGKLEIVKQGRLVNTDTLEYQAEQEEKQSEEEQPSESQGQPEQQPQPQPEPQAAPALNENGESGSTPTDIPTETISANGSESNPSDTSNNLSTGEVIGKGQTGISNDRTATDEVTGKSVVIDVLGNQQDLSADFRQKCIVDFMKLYRENHDIDLDKEAANIINEEVRKGADRQEIERIVNKALSIVKRRIEKSSASKMQSSIIETIVESSLLEFDKTKYNPKTKIYEQVNPFVESYRKAVKGMINEFCKEVGINEINSKKYINVEDLLRYVNLVTNDTETSDMMFDALRSYLSTDEAKKEFITMDEKETNSTIRENIAKSAEQRFQEHVAFASQRVDIFGYRDSLTSEKEIKEFDKTLNELRNGDKLNYTIDGSVIVVKDSKNRILGTLPIPRIDTKTGAYIMHNDGWRYEVKGLGNGNVSCNLKELFNRWLDGVNEPSRELNSIIYKLAYEKLTEEEKNSLYKQFSENEEIKSAIKNGFVSQNSTDKQLVEGLVKLWRYVNNSDGNYNNLVNRRIKESLDNWFEKLKESYDTVTYLSKNSNAEVSVAKISDGEIIRISDEADKESCLPANEAIAYGVNPKIHKIALAHGAPNTLLISGMPTTIFSGVKSRSTFVLIPNRNGNYEYVQAFPADTVDEYIGKDAKEIVEAVHSKFKELLNNYLDNTNQDTLGEFINFAKSVLNSNNGNSSLFFNLSTFENEFVFKITFKEADGFYKTFAINKKSGYIDITKSEYKTEKNKLGSNKTRLYNEHKVKNDLSSETRKYLEDSLDELLYNLRFNIKESYIQSDNAKNIALNGIATRRDGKFDISVGDKTWTYDSFNEFVLSNNLVKLNTKPNENGTSNFNSRAVRSQEGNQILEINVTTPSTTTSPVEGSESQTTTQETNNNTSEANTPTNVSKSINEQALDILTKQKESTNMGLDIASLVFNQEQLKAFENLGLLPKSIIFDENFNNKKGHETINAEYNRDTGTITLGKRWVSLFSNPNTRNQAIRKLIHEQIHAILTEKPKYVNSIKDIYNEFKEYLDNNKVEDDAHIREYLFNKESSEKRALEEFLVESLTSKELADYLNNIEAKVPSKKGAKNLFQKILEVLSDIFGWGITKGSLYEKELKTIREINLDKSIENKEDVKDVTNKENIDSSESNSDNKEISNENKTTEEQQNNQEQEEPKIEVKDEIIGEESEDSDDGFVDISDDLMDDFYSSILEENNNYTSEMQSIKDKAIFDGTFMKINGKPTNLNEAQWLFVRTKAFKDLFGDWERVAYSSKFRESKDIPNSITSATYQGVSVSEAVFDPDMAPNGGKRIIFLGDKYIGEIPIIESKNKIKMSGSMGAATEIEEEYRGKGYGKKAHLALANIAKSEGKTLYSDSSNSDAEDALWKSLVKEGIAEVISESPKVGHWNHTTYRIINDKLPQADDINPGDRGVSKVVDENGEPLVVKHNSHSNNISIFDKTKIGSNGGTLFGKGFYFSENEDYNATFGNNEYSVFLNIKNPLIVDKSKQEYKLYNDYKVASMFQEEDIIQNIMKDKNYDGIIVVNEFEHNVTEYIVWDSNQIKSATDNNGEFSTNDDNIYHSSVEEVIIENMPSISAVEHMLPISQQAEFANLVERGEIETSCK